MPDPKTPSDDELQKLTNTVDGDMARLNQMATDVVRAVETLATALRDMGETYSKLGTELRVQLWRKRETPK